jgi:hypothetical protein
MAAAAPVDHPQAVCQLDSIRAEIGVGLPHRERARVGDDRPWPQKMRTKSQLLSRAEIMEN